MILAADLVDDPFICPNNFFHVAGRKSGQLEPPKQVKYHHLFVSKISRPNIRLNTVSNPMTDFLTAVTQAEK